MSDLHFKSLGELCFVIAGQSPEGLNYNDNGEGLPFYQGKKDFGDKFLEPPRVWTREITKEAEGGDILISVRAPVGPMNFATQKICIGRGLAAIRSKGNVDQNYLHYALLSKQSEIAGNEGAVFASINKRQIEEIQIPFVKLPEQRRIVAILDEVFEGLAVAAANTEKNLKNARELFESYLNSLVTLEGQNWPKKTLKEVSIDFGRGKSKHRPRGDAKLLGGKFPLIQTGDIANCDHFIRDHTQTYNDFGLAQSKLWPKGTVCIAIVGANVAETGILGFASCFPDSVIGLVANDNLANFEYVEYLLGTFKLILKEQGKGTARDNINLATFERLKFPFPNVELQKQIVARLNDIAGQVQNIENICVQKLAAIAELKQSILQKAFAGELIKDFATASAKAISKTAVPA